MAKYTVKFSCGHTDELMLFGKIKDRDRFIKFCETNRICPACYKRQEEERIAELVKSYEEISELNLLPALEGTNKQVVAAFQIRRKLLRTAKDSICLFLENFEKLEKVNKIMDKDMFEKILKEWEASFKSKAESGYWLDRSDWDVIEVRRDLEKYIKEKMIKENKYE